MRQEGFTLLEMMIVTTVLAIIMSIGVPGYRSALRTARITKATQELRTISLAIDMFRASTGRLPLTLYEVGHGGRRDPWGTPYCYLNYAAGTGDGLEWAVSAGLVDPTAFPDSSAPVAIAAPTPPTTSPPASGSAGGSSGNGSGSGSGSTGNGGGSAGSGSAGSGSSGGSSSSGSGSDGSGDGGETGGNDKPDIGSVVSQVAETLHGQELAAFIEDLRQGTSTISVAVPVDSTRRRNRYMFPLNTDYDLFSLGPDAHTAVSLSHPMAIDDVIRANDGGYFGTAAKY